jgi:hypothetical protein
MRCARLLPLVLVAACGEPSASPTDGGPPTDAVSSVDADVTTSPDLGKTCAMGCNLDLCVSTTSPECENQTCVWDGRGAGIGDAYCSQSCEDTGCPATYSCLAAEDGTGTFCFADPAVCGDGVRQRGEACDAGAANGTPASGCAADCQHTIGGGSASFTLDGTPIHLEGTSTDGTLSAHIVNGTIFVSFNATDLRLGLSVWEADLVGPFPKRVLGRVSLTYLFQSWCYKNPEDGLGMVLTIDQWTDGYHLVGSFDGTADYVRCTSVHPDPTDTSLAITASSFDVFLEQ